MALVVESSATAQNTGGDLTVTKPTGLSAGDLMVAFVQSIDLADISAPAGWTTIEEEDGSGAGLPSACFAKEADSSDASATDFTFTASDPAGGNIAALLRISGVEFPVSLVRDDDHDVDSGSGTSHSASFTLDMLINSNSLLLGSVLGIGGDVTVDNYSISGTNPTWNEEVDTNVGNSEGGTFLAVAYASSPGSDTITSFSADLTDSTGNISGMTGFLVCIAETNNDTGTFSPVSVTPTFDSPSGSAGTHATLPTVAISPTVNPASAEETSDIWTNQTRSSTTWTNQNKS